MVEVTVDANHLAPILVVNSKLEPVPDVFRLQEKVLFIITLEEYIKFIEALNDEVDILPGKTSTLKRLSKDIDMVGSNKSDKVTIRDVFYLNMSLAIGKELHFSQVYGRGMSNYVCLLDDIAEPITVDDLDFLYSLIDNDRKLIYQKQLESRGYPINTKRLNKQQDFYYKYALICYNSFVIKNSNWYLKFN